MSATTAMPESAGAKKAGGSHNPWREVLAPYARPRISASLLDLATSIVPYFALQVAMVLLAPVSIWLTLLLSIPAAGFLLRTYIVFHDCAHGSFLPSKRANQLLGRCVAFVVYTPFAAWKHAHAMHHATAGDLDRRGDGDVPTMTVAEFQAASWGPRLMYRLFRHPAILFTIGPFVALVIQPRLTNRKMRTRIRRSVYLTNAALAVGIAGLCLLIGWQTFLLIQVPMVLMAGGAGVFLFFVQHQFEDTYWENTDCWAYSEAALRGSSYLKLPKVLQYFSGNIGLHHVHHLSARIPNYNLQAAHDENPVFHEVPVLTLWQGLRATRLKLWDEEQSKLVTFSEARAPSAAAARTA
jgi:omega-6 fatty acid desaturase (delta-12 desaturase)